MRHFISKFGLGVLAATATLAGASQALAGGYGYYGDYAAPVVTYHNVVRYQQIPVTAYRTVRTVRHVPVVTYRTLVRYHQEPVTAWRTVRTVQPVAVMSYAPVYSVVHPAYVVEDWCD